MSKVSISKEAKKFRDAYEIGNVWLPRLVNGMYMLRDIRCRNKSITVQEVQNMFDNLNFFISYGNVRPECENISLGKGNGMYITLNRGMSLIPFQIRPQHSIMYSDGDDTNYMQYDNRDAPVFSYINHTPNRVELPEGLDIMNLPEESLFQTELCINNKLVQGAAVWMGLRDYKFKLGEIVFYGYSLLQIKRLNAALESVLRELHEKYKS